MRQHRASPTGGEGRWPALTGGSHPHLCMLGWGTQQWSMVSQVTTWGWPLPLWQGRAQQGARACGGCHLGCALTWTSAHSFFFFFFFGESPLHIRVHAKANLGGPNAVYQEEALARRQGSWCSVRHERSQEPVGSRRWGQRKVNVNATGRGPKLTARRLGGDKQRTGPGDVHPGLGMGRAARRLRNNCSGRHERN